MSTPLWAQSATTLAQMIRGKEVSSREVVSAHLDRIEAVNGQVRAITAVLADSALAAADAADRTEPQGPLHGVPFSIKENIDCMGSATTQGLPAMRDAIPTVDGPTVERMKAAGAIPLARTNLPEMGLRIDTENPLHGRTFNPGTLPSPLAVAVAVRGPRWRRACLPWALGMTSRAFLLRDYLHQGTHSLGPFVGARGANGGLRAHDLEGPMARTVADVKAAYDGGGWSPLVLMRADPYRSGGALPGAALPKAFIEAVERAGAVLAEAGWEVFCGAPRAPPGTRFGPTGRCAAQFPYAPAVMSPSGGHAPLAERFPAERWAPAHRERYRLMQRWSTFFEPFRPLPLSHRATWILTTVSTPHSIACARDRIFWAPAMPVPLGVSNGLPVAVQIYADRWREDLCFEAAAQLERRWGSTRFGPKNLFGDDGNGTRHARTGFEDWLRALRP